MPGRTPAAAVGAFVDALQQAVSSVTDSVLLTSKGGFQPASVPHQLAFWQRNPVRLQGSGELALRVGHYYRVVREGSGTLWKVQTAAYLYTFYDVNGREIIAYHWHPQVAGSGFPHLHLSYGLVNEELLNRAGLSPAHNGLRPDFARVHLPTRRIALEDVLHAAIEQLGVEPRREHRRDWDRILRETRARFTVDRSWV